MCEELLSVVGMCEDLKVVSPGCCGAGCGLTYLVAGIIKCVVHVINVVLQRQEVEPEEDMEIEMITLPPRENVADVDIE